MPCSGVPDRECEHTDQLANTVVALLFIEMQDHFDVGIAPEAVAAPNEPSTQFDEVIDLAIADKDDRSVLVHHRLGATFRQVNDRKASMTEKQLSVVPRAFAVRASVPLSLVHAMDKLAGGLRRDPIRQHSGDCTHVGLYSGRCATARRPAANVGTVRASAFNVRLTGSQRFSHACRTVCGVKN